MMKYGYARVSTLTQDLKLQIEQLEKENCEIIYGDKFTGTTAQRPELEKVLGVLEKGDTLVVTKLDRLARNTKEGITIIESLFEKGVRVHALNIGLLENTTMGRFFLQTMLAVAEMERNLIVERTQEGKALARQRGDFKDGRPKKFSKKKMDKAMELLKSNTIKEVSFITEISPATLKREKARRKAEGIL